MYKKIALVFKFLVLLGVVALITWAGHCMVTGKIQEYDSEVGAREDLKGKVTRLRVTEKNPQGEILNLTATKALVKDDRMELEEIDALFESSQRKPMTITSNTGVLENETNNAGFFGNVKLTSQKPFVLETEELNWNESGRVLTSDKYVEYTSNVAHVTGVGIIIDVHSQDVTVLNSVNAHFY